MQPANNNAPAGVEANVSDNVIAGVNLDELQELFTAVQENTSALDGKEIVLVIGNSGVGKSIFINYMLDYQLKTIIDERTGGRELQLVDPDIQGAAKVGRLLGGSATLIPKAYARADVNPLIFCDTGGFPDTRGGSTTIAVHYAIRSVVTTARRIKAIIIMCTEAQLGDKASAATYIAEKIKTMKELLGPDLTGYQDSVFLIFNKMRDRNEEQLRNTVSDIAAELSRSEYELERETANLLSFVKLENILITHPEDLGQSRSLIAERLVGSLGLEGNYKQHIASSFDGGPHYENLRNVSKIIAGRFLVIHQRMIIQLSLKETLEREIEELNAHINQLASLEIVRINTMTDLEVTPCQENIDKNRLILLEKQAQLAECQSEIDTVNEEFVREKSNFIMLERLCKIIVDLTREPNIADFMNKFSKSQYSQSRFFQNRASLNVEAENSVEATGLSSSENKPWFEDTVKKIMTDLSTEKLFVLCGGLMIASYLYSLKTNGSSHFNSLITSLLLIVVTYKLYQEVNAYTTRQITWARGFFSSNYAHILNKVELKEQQFNEMIDSVTRTLQAAEKTPEALNQALLQTKKILETADQCTEKLGEHTADWLDSTKNEFKYFVSAVKSTSLTVENEVARNGRASESLMQQLSREMTSMQQSHTQFLHRTANQNGQLARDIGSAVRTTGRDIGDAAKSGKFKPEARADVSICRIS